MAVAPALAGCLQHTEHPNAALDVPPKYENASRKADGALPSVVWWRGFRSAQLTDLIEEALTSNLDIAAAVARIVQADAQARISGAALLPTVTFGCSATRSRSSSASSRVGGGSIGGDAGGGLGGGGVDVDSDGGGGGSRAARSTFTGSLAASYEIDFWGKNRALRRQAEDIATATRFDRETVALLTVASVANSYFQVLATQDRLRAARENIASAQRVFNLIQERLNIGTASALDTAQQESVLNTQRATVPLLEQALREGTIAIAILVGRAPASVAVRGNGMDSIRVPPVTPGLPSDLLAQRPDIRAAEAQLAGANANVEAARAALLPSIVLTGEGGYASAALRTLVRPESAFFNLAAGLTQPVLDGLRLQGQVDLAAGRQDELLQLYRAAVVNGFGDVERALVAVRQTAERERLQGQVVDSSRRAFQISETRLREGAVDLITVLNTQQTLFQAQDTLYQARLARLQAVVSLVQALGGGWSMPPRGRPAVAVAGGAVPVVVADPPPAAQPLFPFLSPPAIFTPRPFVEPPVEP